MNKNVYIICNLLICFSLLYGCAKSPLDSEARQNRTGFNLLMNEGDPNLGNEAIFDNMRLYCFTQGSAPVLTGSGGSWDSRFSHELYNITRTETALNTNTAKAGLWDLVMVSGAGAELTPPLSSKKSSESLMYTYDPGAIKPDGSRNNAHEIWHRMLRLPAITANTDQSASGAITRNAAMIKVVVDRAVDIDLTSTDHQFELHGVPDKISWSGTLLRTTDNGGYETSLTDPDILTDPLTGRFTFTATNEEPGVSKSDTLVFIIPAHRETDFWTDNVTPIVKAQDTIKHKLSLTVSFAKASGGTFTKTAEIDRAIRCNGILLVCLKMKDVNLELTTSIAPWGEEPVSGDFEAPYLNVSEVATTVYDGAASRIHFRSNQPDDSVYILKEGDGISNVDDVFDRIAGPDAQNRVYDPDTESGYIDIANLDVEAGQPPVKIYLKSGSLRREITVERSAGTTALKNISTPYVGIFYRENQCGERLVTWDHHGPWTAYIDDPESGLLIDRQPSPAFSDGSLYSDRPSDAEIGIITSDATSVSGMNRVYFRVGWEQRSATAAPRYATITVRQGTNDPDGAIIQKIYCRQSPDSDAVYPRVGAARFSPYNLTSVSEHTVVPVGGGIFTEYPTQAGAYFQWMDHVNPRYAYAATGDATPWNKEPPYHERYWTEETPGLDAEYETCPSGYRRVSDGATGGEPTGTSELRQSLWADPTASSATNTLEGFYADGFFDRRDIQSSANGIPHSAVATGGTQVAYRGRLFYNETTGASLFFPMAGQRILDNGALTETGKTGYYWTASSTTSETIPQPSLPVYISTALRNTAVSIRCVAE